MNHNNYRNPVSWVPSVYFAMGLPFIAVNLVSTFMFKDLGISDTQIAFWTSIIMMPWTLKFLWSPFLEMYRTKKFFVVITQLLSGLLFGLVAFSLKFDYFFAISISTMAVIAFSGATHDIACDGVYMAELSPADQAKYIGVQGAFYNIAKLVANGGLVAMVYLLFYARHLRLQPLKWSVKSLRLSVRNIGYQWRIGSSALLGEATLAVLMFVGNQVFMSYLGDDGVGAFGIACYYIPFVFMVGNAIAQSAQPIISYNFGLGYKERVMTAERIALLTAVVCGVVATVAFTVYPYLLVGLFISLDSEAAKIAIHGFPYFASGFVFFIVNIAVVGYFQSVERIKPATIFALLRGFVFLIPSFILLPKFLGVSGIWLAMPLSEALTIIVILLFVLKHRYAYKVSSQLITS